MPQVRQYVHVLQLSYKARQRGMRSGAKVPVSLLSETKQIALQFAETREEKTRRHYLTSERPPEKRIVNCTVTNFD